MSEEILPDGLLLRRYREKGDEAAFAELRRRHGRLVLATCRRETGDPALAEDAAQGAFLLLIRKGFDDDASLAGWLHGAARRVSQNLVRGEVRRRRRERHAFEEIESPDEAWSATAPHIDDALAGLKAGDREAVLLRFAGEMSLAGVGATLGIGENAARMRVSRALDRMRDSLRRAGVGVSALLLASLLSTRLADAEPLSSAPPSSRARRVARVAGRLPSLPLALAGLGIGLATLGGVRYAVGLRTPKPLGAREAQALFARAEGGWSGTLEYADDNTGERIRTDTTVRVDRDRGGVRLVARFADYAVADSTTIVPDGAGRYRIDAFGSHTLNGLYTLARGLDGTPTFDGFSPARGTEVRLRLVVTTDALRIQEEYVREGTYRFRNRYDLTRSIR